MDLVEEQHVAVAEPGEDRSEIALAVDRGPGHARQGPARLGGDDVRERRLAEARGSEQQHVVERLAACRRRVEEHRELLADVALADELGEPPRTQGARGVLVAAILRHGEPLVAHRAAPSTASAARRRSPASPLVFESPSSACATLKPRATSASRAARYSPSAVAITGDGRGARRPDPLAQLEREPLGELAADARDARQLRDVGVDDRPSHDRGAVHREDREGDPRADARDPAQQVEEIALVDVGEAVQRERVLAHDELGLQRHELGRLAGAPGRGRRGVHAQADASDLDHEPVDVLDGEPAAQACDHRAVRSAGWFAGPGMAERDGQRIRGVLGRRLALEPEDRDDHPADLLLRRAAEAADRALDLRRRVLGRGDARRAAGGERDPARLTDREDRARIETDEERLERRRVGRVAREHLDDALVDAVQALARVVARPRGDVAVGERCHALTLDTDHAEPRAGEAGIDTEHDHRAHGTGACGRSDGRAPPLVPSTPDARTAGACRGVRRAAPQILPRRDQRRRRADPRARRRRPVPDRRCATASGSRPAPRSTPNFRPTRWIARRILPTGEYRTGQAEGMRAEQLVRRADGRPSVLVATEECPTGENEDEPGGESFGYTTLIGRTAGMRRIGVNLDVVRPGQRSVRYHWHREEEEGFLVLGGSGWLDVGGERYRVVAGDFFAKPEGPRYAHQFVNDGEADLRILSIGERRSDDVVELRGGSLGARAVGRARRPAGRTRSRPPPRGRRRGCRS